MTMPPIHTMWAAVAAACLVPTDAVAELLQVTILARHGNRAPNGNVHLICPNFADVLQMFDVPVSSVHMMSPEASACLNLISLAIAVLVNPCMV